MVGNQFSFTVFEYLIRFASGRGWIEGVFNLTPTGAHMECHEPVAPLVLGTLMMMIPEMAN